MNRHLAFAFTATLLGALTAGACWAAAGDPAPAEISARSVKDKIEALRMRVRSALDLGEIDSEEASRALRTLRDLRGDEEALRARNGDRLPDAEGAQLEARLDQLSRGIHWISRKGGPAVRPPASLWSLQRREHWFDQRITHAVADGSLDAAEATRLREALTDIRFQDQRLRAGQAGPLAERDLKRLEAWLDRVIESAHWRTTPAEPRPW